MAHTAAELAAVAAWRGGGPSGDGTRPEMGGGGGARRARRDGGPVTIADREAEEAMDSVILKSFPSHAVEENGWRCIEKSDDYVCVLDPMDGTKSFITGIES
uniref:N-amidino-scyllo-inosamine-4-phosphate phosphatase-like protein n=1 Tax=Oryza sativa subsp. japonica TaxID=39947 RepID=Q6K2E3_ORYSJ|nr:N-amidino-scyllo-inosamine-4-phosphate phosphatase-like protein [Oryza sativa Japonica Group]